MKIDQPQRRPVVAILGGGFAGAATAFHLARALPSGEAEIVVVEPRAALGRGLAYSTREPAHRINVPASKMTLVESDMNHFAAWLTSERISLSPGTLTLRGDFFPERGVFGQYVAAQLAPLLASGAVRHRRAKALDVVPVEGGYRVDLSDGETLAADLVVLAMTHPAPAVPWALRGLTGSARLVADPYDNARIAAIAPTDDVLIVGTALTSADVIASLNRHGFRGRITAMSRHGLRSRGHGLACKGETDFTQAPERTAVGLLRRIRAVVAAEAARGRTWHATFDKLREQGDGIWAALDHEERSRLLRHLRRFWDVHRYRIAPQVEAVLDAELAAGRLRFVAGRIVDVTEGPAGATLRYRPRGGEAVVAERFDTIVVTTGPDHGGVLASNPALGALAETGLIEADPLGLGIRVADRCRAIGQGDVASDTLFVAGPLARGGVGELMGAPEVARHAEQLAGLLAQRLGSLTVSVPEAAGPRPAPGRTLWAG